MYQDKLKRIKKHRVSTIFVVESRDRIYIIDLSSNKRSELKRNIRTQKAAIILSDSLNYKATTKSKFLKIVQQCHFLLSKQVQELLNIELHTYTKQIFNYGIERIS